MIHRTQQLPKKAMSLTHERRRAQRVVSQSITLCILLLLSACNLGEAVSDYPDTISLTIRANIANPQLPVTPPESLSDCDPLGDEIIWIIKQVDDDDMAVGAEGVYGGFSLQFTTLGCLRTKQILSGYTRARIVGSDGSVAVACDVIDLDLEDTHFHNVVVNVSTGDCHHNVVAKQ